MYARARHDRVGCLALLHPQNYKREMDTFAGIGKGFVANEALIEHHKLAYEAALAKFDGVRPSPVFSPACFVALFGDCLP